jgi:hypothetical protein
MEADFGGAYNYPSAFARNTRGLDEDDDDDVDQRSYYANLYTKDAASEDADSTNSDDEFDVDADDMKSSRKKYDYGFEDDEDDCDVEFGRYSYGKGNNSMSVKNKKTKPKSPKQESVYKLMLKWDVNSLLQDSRAVLGMSPHMKPTPRHFNTNSEYYSAMKDIAVEETRASVAQALLSMNANNGNQNIELSLDPNFDDYFEVSSSRLLNVRFIVGGGHSDNLRPGCVYKLTCQLNRSHRYPFDEGNSSNKGNGNSKRRLGEGSSSVSGTNEFSCMAAFSYYQRQATGGGSSSVEDNAVEVDDGTLQPSSSGRSRHRRAMIWVHANSFIGQALKAVYRNEEEDSKNVNRYDNKRGRSGGNRSQERTSKSSKSEQEARSFLCALADSARWKCAYVTNIINYQRMVFACDSTPNPPCLIELLGSKLLATHIKFGDSDDDSADDSGAGTALTNLNPFNDLIPHGDADGPQYGELTTMLLKCSFEGTPMAKRLALLNSSQRIALEYCLLPIAVQVFEQFERTQVMNFIAANSLIDGDVRIDAFARWVWSFPCLLCFR